MELDILTFEDLRNIQKYEKENEFPYELDDEMVNKIKEYLARKKKNTDRISMRELENSLAIIEDIFDRRTWKIVRLAFLSLKTHLPDAPLLREERQLFDKLREFMKNYRNEKYEYLFAGQSNLPIFSQFEKYGDQKENNSQEELKKEEEKSYQEKVEDREENSEDGIKVTAVEEEIIKENSSEEISEESQEKEEIRIEIPEGFRQIKVLKEVPAFMGTDLEEYGPYSEGSEATLPQKNAELLISQGMAEDS